MLSALYISSICYDAHNMNTKPVLPYNIDITQ